MDGNESNPRFNLTAISRILARLLVVLFLVWLTHIVLDWTMTMIDDLEHASQVRFGVLSLFLVIYTLLMALPFVPGVEIGISLMMLEGGAVAPFVYIATLTGLLLAFFVGRMVDCRVLKRFMNDLHLNRISQLLDAIAPLDGAQRLELLHKQLPSWIPPAVIRFRYVVLALLLNVPGNVFIGGGGGLAMIAGFSQLYSVKYTTLTFAIAVAPIPVMVFFLDIHVFG